MQIDSHCRRFPGVVASGCLRSLANMVKTIILIKNDDNYLGFLLGASSCCVIHRCFPVSCHVCFLFDLVV